MAAPWSAGAQLRIMGEIHGQQTVNVLHFGTNTQINDPQAFNTLLVQLAQAMKECVVEFLLPAVTSDWRFVATEARGMFPQIIDPVVATGQPENVGELSAASHSFACSLMKISTTTGGRSGRGRNFLPPCGEAETTASTINGPTLVLLAAFTACVAEKFMGAGATTDWRLGVLSKLRANPPLTQWDQGFFEAVAINLKADCAVLTRRRKGRGV